MYGTIVSSPSVLLKVLGIVLLAQSFFYAVKYFCE